MNAGCSYLDVTEDLVATRIAVDGVFVGLDKSTNLACQEWLDVLHNECN